MSSPAGGLKEMEHLSNSLDETYGGGDSVSNCVARKPTELHREESPGSHGERARTILSCAQRTRSSAPIVNHPRDTAS
jgi:hypothetical protein